MGLQNRFIKILFNVLTFLIPCECAIFERVLRKNVFNRQLHKYILRINSQRKRKSELKVIKAVLE